MADLREPGRGARIRVVAALLLLISFLAVADVTGRLVIDPAFHVSEIMFGSLTGALLLVLGIDVSKRWPF